MERKMCSKVNSNQQKKITPTLMAFMLDTSCMGTMRIEGDLKPKPFHVSL